MSKGSLDFNKPIFLQNLIEKKRLNTSNLFYEDLFSFVFRECKKTRKIQLKSKINNILFVQEENTYSESSVFSKIFKKKNNKQQINTQNIIEKYKNQLKIKFDILTYVDDKKLYYQNHSKKKINFNISNLKKIINNYDVIVCTPCILSLLIKFFFKNKCMLLFDMNSETDKIITNNLFLNRNFNYIDIFDCKFNNFRELNLFLFKKYTEF